ncbi:ArsR/SmtB family transcription factor [Paraliobacillus ryukyuensis]|uniref:ArsR/SmtB family transcription factor n=1 Tax=Paraliobacillus ryukyuensis TaxID=200904 RepID=UPI0009A7C779|nr:metalloregulator ArsR/SmtB family transcription factor [Paraliobacillus ryukyuensis]
MQTTTIKIDSAAIVLKLLGDKTRLTMVKLLETHNCCVCEFVEIFQASQPSISQHLRKLRDVGLVNEQRRGQWIFYSINTEHAFFPFLKEVLKQVPKQDYRIKHLEENGTRITCC